MEWGYGASPFHSEVSHVTTLILDILVPLQTTSLGVASTYKLHQALTSRSLIRITLPFTIPYCNSIHPARTIVKWQAFRSFRAVSREVHGSS